MLIHVEVAGGANVEVERAVARGQLEHVIEKADAGGDLVPAFALDAEAHANLGLARSSLDQGTAHSPSSASIAVSVWRTSPAVIRMQPLQPGSLERSRTRMPRAASAATTSSGSLTVPTLMSTKLPPLFQYGRCSRSHAAYTSSRDSSTCARYHARYSRSPSAAVQPATAKTLKL